jgi:RES domain-containing protein
VRLQAPAYRAHHPQWSWTPLSGEGAGTHGGRFNPKGVPALYLSLDWSTAILEASQGFAFRIPPLTIVSYDVDCDDIADLTNAAELKRLGARRADLGCAWKLLAETGREVPSWVLVERLRADDIAGIVVPSFAPGAARNARNLVLWRWSDKLPHKVTVFDPESRLPRDDSSWRS